MYAFAQKLKQCFQNTYVSHAYAGRVPFDGMVKTKFASHEIHVLKYFIDLREAKRA